MTADGSRGAVVVTGTSSGIGAACALRLADEGFSVFAGVRRAEDVEAVQQQTEHELTPLVVDITDEAAIAAAADVVGRAVGSQGIAGLVNNAGIVVPGPLEFQPMSDLRHQFDVDLFGQVAMTQAFLPLIRVGNGRIVNIGSIGGRMVLPIAGGYSASKFAMEAITDAFRLELREWGIHVALIDPGGSDSAIFGKVDDEMDNAAKDLHARDIHFYDDQIAAVKSLIDTLAGQTSPADHVAKAVAHALKSKRPKTRYLAGKGAKAVGVIAKAFPDHLKDFAIAHGAHMPGAE
jgi:NAD(P)-dependent dehydrogenase (short-subunit alcohol dehydrogenase family)